jgi:hypothetical protein
MPEKISPLPVVHIAIHVQKLFADRLEDEERREVYIPNEREFADRLLECNVPTIWAGQHPDHFWMRASMEKQWHVGVEELGIPARPGEVVLLDNHADVLDNPLLDDYLRRHRTQAALGSGTNTRYSGLNSFIGITAAGLRGYAIYDRFADSYTSAENDRNPLWHRQFFMNAQATLAPLAAHLNRFFICAAEEVLHALKEKPAHPEEGTPPFFLRPYEL